LFGCQLPKEIPTIKSIDNATHDMTKWFTTKQHTLFAKYGELIFFFLDLEAASSMLAAVLLERVLL